MASMFQKELYPFGSVLTLSIRTINRTLRDLCGVES
jgi:hypothetical protein